MKPHAVKLEVPVQCRKCLLGSPSASDRLPHRCSTRQTSRFLTFFPTVCPLWCLPRIRTTQVPRIPGNRSTRLSRNMKSSASSALSPVVLGGLYRSNRKGMTKSLRNPLVASCSILQGMRVSSVRSSSASPTTSCKARRKRPGMMSPPTFLRQLEFSRGGREFSRGGR